MAEAESMAREERLPPSEGCRAGLDGYDFLQEGPAMTYDERVAEFKARIDAGEKIEAGDWMPDEYRVAALKFIEMHANSEVMGALPEGTWIPRAPTLKRKLSLTAKVQDEVG